MIFFFKISKAQFCLKGRWLAASLSKSSLEDQSLSGFRYVCSSKDIVSELEKVYSVAYEMCLPDWITCICVSQIQLCTSQVRVYGFPYVHPNVVCAYLGDSLISVFLTPKEVCMGWKLSQCSNTVLCEGYNVFL